MTPTIDEFVRLNRNPYGLGVILPPSPVTIVKDIDTLQGIVTMYWAAFGNTDSYREVIVPGAFKKTIKEWGPKGRKRIAHLFNHNPTHRIGVPLELTEDSHGLLSRCKILGQDHSKGRDALIEYEEGCITEHSIGFRIVKWEFDTDEELLRLLEIQLYEGSGVTWGANMETPTVDVKALREDPLLFENMASQLKAIERCLKREITDARAIELEDQLSSFRRIMNELDKALRSEYGLDLLVEPLSNKDPERTPSNSEPPEIAHAKAMIEILSNLKLENHLN